MEDVGNKGCTRRSPPHGLLIFTKMSVSELRTYADTVQVACNIAKSDKDDMFLEIFKTINSGAGFNRAAATKEDG